MHYVAPFIDKCNTFVGIVVAVATYVFGQHWWLFGAYLLLNIGDWITGWLKSAIAGKTSSAKGLKGVIKKIGYWIMIAIAFGMSAIFIEAGLIIGVDLGVTVIFGWFVLVSLIVNELRSILENFVEAGYKVPRILTVGLEAVENKIDAIVDELEDGKEAKDDETE